MTSHLDTIKEDVRRHLRWALVFFFISGMTGLIYEVLWTRRLSLIFGHTVLAVSTVVACFMTGLGLGSLIAGRLSDRRANQQRGRFLAIYGALEIFIGLWAFLSIPLLNFVESAYLGLSTRGMTGSPLYFACLAFAMLVLVPPTTAMGATLPVMSRLLVLEKATVGHLLARLYGLNTLGAFTGAGLAGFVLLPQLGSLASVSLTALTNLTIGALAVGIGRRPASHRVETSPQMTLSEEAEKSPESPGWPTWLVPLSFGMAGVSSMGFQIAWTRGLALSLGSSTYAFTTILTTFLAGLGLGSLLYPKLLGKRRPTLTSLAWLQASIGLAGAVSIPLLGVLPLLFLYVMRRFDLFYSGLYTVLAVDVGLSALLLLLPTLLMGLAFPLANQLYTQSLSGLGKSVGEIYSANTLGCIIGSILAGFVCIPVLGAQTTLKLAAVANLLVALLLLLVGRKSKPHPSLLAPLLTIVMVASLPAWEPGLMTGGVGFSAPRYFQAGSESLLYEEPAFYRDGLSCTVTVMLDGSDELVLKVNGKTDASLAQGDQQTQYLAGYLPAMFHSDPKRIAVIGLGGGQSAEALATIKGVEHVDVVELEHAVVEAQKYWGIHNDFILKDPRVQVHATDGRTFILGSPDTFDIIASEPSNPWIAGIGNLFTLEFYQKCAQRLNPGGVMCQWFNLYAASVKETDMVLHTFFTAFPEGSVWMSSYGDLLLIGSNEKLTLDPERLRARWESNPEIQSDFYNIGLFEPENLFGQYLFSREDFMKSDRSKLFNTDDKPALEYSAPFNLYRPTDLGAVIDSLFEKAKTHPALLPLTAEKELSLAQGWVNIQRIQDMPETAVRGDTASSALLMAQMALRLEPSKREEAARKRFALALKLEPQNSLAAALTAEFEEKYRNFQVAADLYRLALKDPPPGTGERLTRGLARCLIQSQQLAEAETVLAPYMTHHGETARANELWGQLMLARKEPVQSIPYFQKATKLNYASVLGYWGLAEAYVAADQLQEAEKAYRSLLELTPNDSRALINLGVVLAKLGKNSESAETFKKVLSRSPNNQRALEYLTILRNS